MWFDRIDVQGASSLDLVTSKLSRAIIFVGSLIVVIAVASDHAAAETPYDTSPRDDQTRQLVEAAIAHGKLPGAVVCIADREKIRYLAAMGDRQVDPTREPMTTDTVFDLASITKPVATATSVMLLLQRGEIQLDDPVSKHLVEFTGAGRETITVGQLLLHTGGLIADNALSDYSAGRATAWQRICNLSLKSDPGTKFIYSDVGYIVLGELVHRVSGQRLDQFSAEHIFQPLKMTDTTFNPAAELIPRIAPTERRDGTWIRGQVHDPRAFLMEGVAGHAGLFSTAGDLVRYGQMMLRDDSEQGNVLSRETIAVMTQPHDVFRGNRTLGWDHSSPYSRNGGAMRSPSAYGHGGFTGTVLWIDPETEMIFVFLSSRLHPDGEGEVNTLAGEIATIWQH